MLAVRKRPELQFYKTLFVFHQSLMEDDYNIVLFMNDSAQDLLTGIYTYRSWNNDPDLSTSADDLIFGQGFIRIDSAPFNALSGVIYGTDDNTPTGNVSWELALKGSTNYGNPFTIRFQGSGKVSGHEWIYDYVGYLVLPWPNGIDQATVLTGSIVRAIPHPGGDGTIHPAGVTATWYAVKNSDC